MRGDRLNRMPHRTQQSVQASSGALKRDPERDGDNRMDSHPKLNPAIQGLDVFVDVDGKPVRAIIPRLVFEQSLHCLVGPDEWQQVYVAHARDIDAVVRRRHGARAQDFVVLRTSDFAHDT